MPIIALPRSQALPDVPAPVLDRQKRPTVDLSQQMAAVGQLWRIKAPELDAAKLAAPSEGLVTIGRSIAQAGSIAGALAEHVQKAENVIAASGADTKMDVFLNDFNSYKDTHPEVQPGEWLTKFNDQVAPLRSELLDNPNLHPDAKADITLRFNRWAALSASNVNESAQKTIFAQAKGAVLGNIENATAIQDPGRFEAGLKQGLESAYLHPFEAEALRTHYTKVGEQLKKVAEADAYHNAESSVVTFVSGLGKEEGLKKLESGELGKFDPVDQENLRRKGLEVAREREAEAKDTLTDMVVTGDIKSGKDVDAFQNVHASLKDREETKAWLARRDDAAARIDREENGVKYAVELRHKIETLDPKADNDGTQQFEILRDIADKADPASAPELKRELRMKYGIDPGPKGRDEVWVGIRQQVNAAFNPAEGVSPSKVRDYEIERHKLDDDPWGRNTPERVKFHKGDPVIDPETKQPKRVLDKNGNEVFKLKIDPAAEQRRIAAETKVMQTMSDWVKGNPEAAKNPVEVQKQLRKVIPAGARSETLSNVFEEKLEKAKAAGTPLGRVTSFGYEGDSTPDSASLAGIGAFAPDNEAEKIKKGLPSDYRLRDGDIAVSPDIEKQFKAKGVKPNGAVLLTLANGERRLARWADRTAQDADVLAGKIPKVTKPLRGRFDMYSPTGAHRLNDVPVIGWEPA